MLLLLLLIGIRKLVVVVAVVVAVQPQRWRVEGRRRGAMPCGPESLQEQPLITRQRSDVAKAIVLWLGKGLVIERGGGDDARWRHPLPKTNSCPLTLPKLVEEGLPV